MVHTRIQAVPEPLRQSCSVLAVLQSVPPAREGAEQTAATAAMLLDTPRGAPAAVGLLFKNPSAPLPPPPSFYASSSLVPLAAKHHL